MEAKRIEVIKQVPLQKLQVLLEDYKDAGAEVKAKAQKDGSFEVEAVFSKSVEPKQTSQNTPVSGAFW